MFIAIPVCNGKLDLHFGHCKEFSIIKIDPKTQKILSRENVKAPPHEPGLLPSWLAKLHVNMVIAGGMGQRAKELFIKQDITVLVGAPQLSPEELVGKYLKGTLICGENCCDH